MGKYAPFNYDELMSKESYFGAEVEPKAVPAPIGGWNNIDPLAHMEPKYAITLQNWVPRPGWIEVRGGSNVWNQSISGNSPVQSLMVYRPTGVGNTEKLIAACGAGLFDVSVNGTNTLIQGGFTSSRFQYINYTVPNSTSYLYVVNGVDTPGYYNGTVWTNAAITGTVNSPSLFNNIHSHQNRIFFVEKNSTRIYYLAAGSITGAVAGVIDVGGVTTLGGYVISTFTWTIDGGNGPNAMFCILTNKGQVIIYQGVDPTNAAAWSLVGVFKIPAPIGNRPWTQMGSDVAIITNQGLLPMSKALPFNPAAQRELTFTAKIQTAMLAAAQNYGNNFGWEVLTFTKQTLLILNIPLFENVNQTQYVMNLLTGAWCSFTGWNANCFAIFNENLYFGDNSGKVWLAYVGKTDLQFSIQCDCKCAFNFFEINGRNKNLTMVKPYIVADGTITPTIFANTDFSDSSSGVSSVISTNPISGVWDSAIWDAASWGGGIIALARWQSVLAIGTCIALRVQVNYAGSSGGGSSGGGTNLLTSVGVFDSGVFDTAVFDGTGILAANPTNLPVLQLVGFETIVQPGGPV